MDTPLGAATDEQGRFSIPDVPVGTYTVQASLVGYRTVEREIQVETDETTTFKIELSQESVELSSITVTDQRGGYVASEISSSNKIGASLTETPQSVSVITRDQLAARGVDRLSEALRYTPGVQGETFGFDATQSGLFGNGLQLRNPAFAVGYSPGQWAVLGVDIGAVFCGCAAIGTAACLTVDATPSATESSVVRNGASQSIPQPDAIDAMSEREPLEAPVPRNEQPRSS